MSEPAIVLKGVCKRAGKTAALDDITATIDAGRLVGIVGPNGSGKTSLIRLIAGLLQPDTGRIEVLGRDMAHEAAAVQAAIGYVPQSSGVCDRLTVLDNLELHAGLHDVPRASRPGRFSDALRLTGLEGASTCRAGALPVGLKQRLGLACALIGAPRLLLLDDPSAALDPLARREWLQIAHALVDGGATVVWATARYDEAEQCEHVLLLNDGRIIAEGSPARIAARLEGRVHAVRVSGWNRRIVADVLRATEGIEAVEIGSGAVRFVTDSSARRVAMPAVPGASTPRTAAPRLEECVIALLNERRPAGTAAARARPVKRDHRIAVEASGLTKQHGRVRAVDGVSFAVRRGETFGLIGPCGAGKTTILRMLCGLLSPTEGAVRVGGVDLRRAPPAARARIGYMSQGSSLYGELSVAENLRFLGAAYGMDRRGRADRVDRLMVVLGLQPYANRRFETLPIAAKRGAALAATLMHAPDVVLLDDPTAGLDPCARRDLWRHIEALSDGGVAVVIASRSAAEGERCDRLLLAYQGRSLAIGSPDEVLASCPGGGESDVTLEDAFAALIAGDEQRRAA